MFDPRLGGRVPVVGDIKERVLGGERVDVDALVFDPGVVLGDVDREFIVFVEVGVGVVAGLEGDVVGDRIRRGVNNDRTCRD
ncbi:hypothetical protein DJ80_05395 [Halorubrum ezzemoulense]|uniref:Uncharacterized protein n=1 Tax=Halorubrum ezzemoulense TaxID=337243 RepID=A0A256J696_HALEZ|nr:hypothetical protein DJ80_05395 [Halorubrum ezzemoulense]